MKHSLMQVPIAIVYDHLTTTYGGAEVVLQVLLDLFPNADLFSTVYEAKKISWLKNRPVHASFLQSLGPLKNFHQVLLPLHPIAIEQLDVSSYQIVISITAGVAKGVITLPQQLHVCYMLTPPRYLEEQDSELENYLRSHQIVTIPGLTVLTKPLFSYLQAWDEIAAWRPDRVVAISTLVATRIETRYHRKSDRIIYPPFIPNTPATDTIKNLPPFLLSFCRLASYKRVDLSIKAALKSKRLLVVAGDGPERLRLQAIEPSAQIIRKKSQSILDTIYTAVAQNKTIVFLGHCSNDEKALLFNNCTAVLMPGIEDFGLTGLEAASCGKPIITHSASGIAEILTTEYAIHIQEKSAAAVSDAIQSLEKKKFDSTKLKSLAKKYDQESFSKQFLNTLYQFWRQHSTISAVSLKT